MAADRIGAVVLAGGINRIPLFEGYTPGYKALVPYRGRPSILYTLDALKAVPRVEQVCIVGPEAELRPAVEGHASCVMNHASTGHMTHDTRRMTSAPRPRFVEGGDTLRDSIFNGLRHFAGSRRVLVLTADMPLVTPQAITGFLAACGRIPTTDAATLFLSVVPRRCYTGPYVRFTKPFNRFRDIEVCHGNLWLADPRLLENTRAIACINRVYNARKNPVTSALAVGPRVGLAYVVGVHLLHALTLAQMTRIAARRFGVAGEAVIVEHPEITIDVDEPDDYEFVVEQLST
jgi:CTP:molybdopterin cytidylyltransferase MocA